MALGELRARIDALDERIIEAIAARMSLCADVAREKARLGASALQQARVDEVEQRYRGRAAEAGISPEFAAAVFRLIHSEAIAIETRIIGGERG